MIPAGEAGCHQVFHRVGGQRRQRVDLIGDTHRSQFSRHRGADATGDHKAGEHGSKFPRHRQHHEVRDGALGGETGEAGVGLQGQHHAGEHRCQRHDGQAEIADLQQCATEQASVDRRAEQMRQAFKREQRQRAGGTAKADNRLADRCQEIQYFVHAVRYTL